MRKPSDSSAFLAESGMALELLSIAALIPECDELFARVPWLSPEERRAVIAQERLARSAWGEGAVEDEE